MAYFDRFYGSQGVTGTKPTISGGSSTGSAFFDDFYDEEKRKKKYGEIKIETKKSPKQDEMIKPSSKATPSFVDTVKETASKATKAVGNFLFGEQETFMQQKLPKTEKLKEAGFSDEQINGFTLSNYQKIKESEDRVLSLKQELIKQRAINQQIGKGVKVDKSQQMPVETFSSKEREIKALEDQIQILKEFTGQAETNKGFIKRFATLMDTGEEAFRNLTPFVNSFIESAENKRMREIENKLNANKPLSDEEKAYVKRRDAKVVQAYIDKGWGDVIAEGLAPNTSYLVDFALTGGAYSGPKAAVQASMKQAPKIVANITSGIIGSLAQGSVRIPAISQKMSEYMLPKYDLVAGEKGDILLKKLDEGDSFTKALGKGYISTVWETLSEHSGAIIEDSTSFLKKAILSRFAVLNRIASPKQLINIAEKVGWNGIIPEVFEEYVQYFGQQTIDQAAIELPDPTRLIGRSDLEKAVPEVFTKRAAEQFLITTVGVAMQGSILNISNSTLNRALELKSRGDIQPIDIEVKEESKAKESQKQAVPDVVSKELEKRGELSSLVQSLMNDNEKTAVEMILAGNDPQEIMKEVGDNAYGMADKALSGEQGTVSYLLDTYVRTQEPDIKEKVRAQLDKYFAENPDSDQMDMYKEVIKPVEKVVDQSMEDKIKAIQQGKDDIQEIGKDMEQLPKENANNVQEITTATTEKAISSLVANNIEATPDNIASEIMRTYMDKPPTEKGKYLTKEAVDKFKGIGVDELKFDKNNKIVLYRQGEITVGEPNAFSTKALTDHTPYIIDKSDIVINTTSEKFEDKLLAPYSNNKQAVDLYRQNLKEWNDLESEVIVIPKSQPTSELKQISESEATKQEQQRLLRNAKRGEGKYEYGDVYYQEVSGSRRGVIVTGKNEAGEVIGYYLPTTTESKIVGDSAYLIEATFKNPDKELKMYSASSTTEKIRELLAKKFGIEQESKDQVIMVEDQKQGAVAGEIEEEKKKEKKEDKLKETVKETIITTNEQRPTDDNKLIAGERVSDNQEVGAGSAGDTGEDNKISGGEVARGGQDVSDTSTRVGSTARITQTIDEILQAHASVDKVTGEVSIEQAITKAQEAVLRGYKPAGGMESKGAEGRGLLDEYYTPESVAKAMWDIVGKYIDLNVDGKAFEPSAGVGRFVETAPEAVEVDAFEINEKTAQILKLLNPDVNVSNKPFEDMFVTSRGEQRTVTPKYDVVIGNPPYGEHRGRYLGMGEEAKIKKYEEYFIKRALDITNDRGIVAMLVPSGILRTSLSTSKELIASLGELQAAYRFPNGIFDTTEIGTDLLVFRKNSTSDEKEIYKRANKMSNDNYFVSNMDNILGQQIVKRGKYGDEKFVEGTLSEALDRLSKLSGIEIAQPQEVISEAEIVSNGTNPQGETFKDNEGESKIEPKVKAPKEIERQVDSKVTTTSSKKDEVLSLSTDIEDLEVWNNITATGEMSSEYVKTLNIKDTKEFVSNKINVVFDGGSPVYYSNFMYYQGNVYEKLDNLEQYKDRLNEGQYERQKKGLQSILPKPMTVNELQLQPTSDFINNLSYTIDGRERTLKSLFSSYLYDIPPESFEDSNSYEVRGYVDGTIVNSDDKVRNAEIRRRRRRVGNKLFQRFVTGELGENERKVLEDKYNRAFNAVIRPDYSKVPLVGKINKTFKTRKLILKPIQLEGAAFLASKGVGLLGYDVGVGKTVTAILALNESMTRGFTKRPLIIVPNGVYLNWIKEIQDIIPNVKINLLANLGGKFKGDLKKFKVEDGTISIMTYDGLTKLGFKQETYDKLLTDLKDTIAGMSQMTKRNEEKEKAKADEYIGKAIKKTTDQVTFEDLNFDHVTMDEVHNFKNIFTGAKLKKGKGNEYRNVQGSSSARGIKAYLMTQYILGQNKGRNVHLLSATPFTNSPLEIYSVMSLMAKKRLEEQGIKNVNEFMSMFMELKPTFVIKADQSMQEMDVIEKFINVQQLQKLVNEYIDFRTGDEAGVFRPIKDKKRPVIYPTKKQYELMKKAEELFTKTKDGGVIQAITEMQNITLSPYLSRYITYGKGDATEVTPEDIKKKYYVATAQGYVEMKGESVDLPDINYLKAFVSKRIEGKGYSVNEETTGLMLGTGDTRQEAVSSAVQNINRNGKEPTLELIEKKKTDGNVSPRVTGVLPATDEKGEEFKVLVEDDYKSFVEESPKIKYAMELIKQTKKDNSGVGQVIYMPRGVQYFSYLRKYLTDELKYKAAEVAIIQGGMTVDDKQSIQDDFNKGKIKVLIGTEAIKEGINLQENATDLYYLHLPWNPTDILQVEGRIWRQGNKWKNVRIHYPLVENSVDAFIFQKLETKEKRIKNLWSYKGNVVEVGDLDFEEMKLDLLSDPVKRVEAEKKTATTKENQKLAVMMSDKAFIKRMVEKYNEAQRDIEYSEKALARAKESGDKDDYEFYKKDVTKNKAKLNNIAEQIAKVDSSIDKMRVDLLAKEKEIEAQEELIDGLDEKYRAKLEVAKQEKAKMVTDVKPTDYKLLAEKIAEENKTFFAKAEMKAPSGKASKGNYNLNIGGKSSVNVSIEKAVATSIDMPEMVKLAEELSGKIPTIKKMKQGKQGEFSVLKGIMLDAEIFKDTRLASKVLAHEIGHLADAIPNMITSRGNILGRIATLNKFLKGTFSDDMGEIRNKEIRKELKELTMMWNPFDENINEGYTKYRYSSSELYAEALSVLLNDPALLKSRAPKFWSAFFDYLDRKESVKMQLFETWNLINKGEEAVLNERDKNIDEMFKKGDDKFMAKALEDRGNKEDYLFKLRYDFVDRNQKVIDDIKRAQKKGIAISPDDNPQYMLEGYNYVGGVIRSYVENKIQPIYKEVLKSGNTWTDFGKVLFLERVMYERGELANPLGQTKETAELQMAQLAQKLGQAKMDALMSSVSKFREAIKSVLTDAQSSGFYSEELVKDLQANPAYATYQVLDYLDTYIDARVKQQIGTLKEIANPADATIQKTMSLIKAIEKNKTKSTLVKFYKENFVGEIVDAKYMWTGKTRIPTDPDDIKLGLLTVYEKGKLRGYYVDKYVAETVTRNSTGTNNAALSILRFFNSRLYRPLFITYNPGFIGFNAMRDFVRYWKNVPNLPIWRAFYRYGQAVGPAFARAIDQPNDVIKEMEKQKILSVTMNDILAGQTEVDTQIEYILQKYGTMDKPKKKLNILTPIVKILDVIEKTGNFIETLPKVAAYVELNNKMPSAELAQFIRTKAGSPDFLRRGASYAWSNEVFLFSNSIKEGIRSDLEVATNPKTAVGFWWKTALVSVLPKVLMFVAVQGLLGEAIRKMFEQISEYDKTNYTNIPIGFNEYGKVRHIRIPQDESSRFVGAIFWKLLKMTDKDRDILRDTQEILSIGAGQFPSLSPTIGTAIAAAQFAFGQNPYDFFRNRNVIPDQEFKAGGMYKLKPFATWMFEQLGGSVIMKTYITEQMPSSKSWEQKILELPILSNIVGRWIKVSDYGIYEKARKLELDVEERKARESIESKKLITQYAKEYMSGSKNLSRKLKLEQQLVREVLGKLAVTKEEKTKATNIKKKFRVAVVSGEYDTVVDRFFTAGTNEEKIIYLKEIQKSRTKSEFSKLISVLKREKLLSTQLYNKFIQSK